MRKHLEQLNKAKAEAEATYAKRIKTYDERTDNWKETYKAQLYKDRTESLELFIDNLEDSIDSLETYLD
tara:strand:- start:423 stop:629 length:207 start_codon:yes stop_codon:yes gene_type:complete